jgi:hypothetical protein
MIGLIDELIDYYEALEDQEIKNRECRAQNNHQSNRQNATGSNEFHESNASAKTTQMNINIIVTTINRHGVTIITRVPPMIIKIVELL